MFCTSILVISDTKQFPANRPIKNLKLRRKAMKKMIILMMLITFASVGVAIAVDTVVYEAKKGNVTFNHKAHSEVVGDCAKCHEGEPAKIEIDKASAHKDACKTCHKEMSGPTKCNDCHKK
jgi:hypothetical protein